MAGGGAAASIHSTLLRDWDPTASYPKRTSRSCRPRSYYINSRSPWCHSHPGITGTSAMCTAVALIRRAPASCFTRRTTDPGLSGAHPRTSPLIRHRTDTCSPPHPMCTRSPRSSGCKSFGSYCPGRTRGCSIRKSCRLHAAACHTTSLRESSLDILPCLWKSPGQQSSRQHDPCSSETASGSFHLVKECRDFRYPAPASCIRSSRRRRTHGPACCLLRKHEPT